ERIDQHRDREHPRATEAVTQRTEDQSTDAPTYEKKRGDFLAHRLDSWISRRFAHQRRKGGDASQGEQSLVQTIETPGCRSHSQHEPVVAVEELPPRTVIG